MSEQVITKRCPKCKQVKPLSEFFKRRNRPCGYQGYCKKCKCACQSKYQKTDYYKEYLKKYRRTEKQIAYANLPRVRDITKKAHRNYCKNHPERILAKQEVRRAVHYGLLIKVKYKICCVCGNTAEAYHHYLGYAKEHWLDVVPICNTCHKKVHSSSDINDHISFVPT